MVCYLCSHQAYIALDVINKSLPTYQPNENDFAPNNQLTITEVECDNIVIFLKMSMQINFSLMKTLKFLRSNYLKRLLFLKERKRFEFPLEFQRHKRAICTSFKYLSEHKCGPSIQWSISLL